MTTTASASTPRQKTVHPPEELTPKQVEKWLNEQAVLFERECRHTPQPVQQLTLAKYIDLWLTDIAPGKLGIVSASSLLGFYIGVQTGADMERHISDSKLPEQILNAFQELNE